MNMCRLKLLCLLLCLPLLLTAQEIELKRERTFTATGLYGFMNGGTDQFLEYGVKSLVVRNIVYKGEEYDVEIYEMPTPEEAYGIYSIHTFRCERADTLGCIDCMSTYQLQAVSGNYYISIVFISGTDEAKNNADELMRYYAQPGDDFKLPPEVKLNPPYSGKLKLLKGPLSLASASPALFKLLKGFSYTSIWFTSEKSTGEYTAWVYLTGQEKVKDLKEKLSSVHMLSFGENHIVITGIEEEKEDSGSFGF